MSDAKPNLDKQYLTVSNELWTVELYFESGFCDNKILSQNKYDKTIELNELGNWTSILTLKTIYQNNIPKSCAITGIDGGVYLYSANEKDTSYTVKLNDNLLFICLGFTFLSFDISKQEVNWKIRPDTAEIFEFYDLDDDFLVRGELEIHRIDKYGKVKWSYGGRDIWVNMDGKKEVQILGNKILLTDFYSNKYLIDLNGKTLDNNVNI